MAAAQNTISILETIKKKMQKFDDKAPVAAAPVAQAAPAMASGPSSAARDLAAQMKSVPQNPPAAPAAPIAPAPATDNAADNFDDLDLDDLDLDDENAFPKAASAQAPAPMAPKPAAPSAPNDDLKDLGLEDDDLLLDDDHHDLDLEHHEEEHKDDLDLDNDLDFSDLEHEETPVIKAPKAEEKKSLSMDDLDNLSLEDLESGLALGPKAVASAAPVPPQAPKMPAPQAPIPQMPKMQPPQAQPPKMQAAPLMPAKPPIAAPVKDDLFDDEFEKELMDFEAEKKPQVSAIPPVVKPVTPMPQTKSQPLMQALKKPTEPAYQQPVAMKPQPMAMPPVKEQVAYMNKSSILTPDTIRQTTDSVKKLMDAKNMVSGIKTFSQSPALAEVAIQLLEPKLEKWLNENLTQIVEDIVRQEIKNIIPKD